MILISKIYTNILLFCFSLIYYSEYHEKMQPLFKCEVDKTESIPIFATKKSPIEKPNYKRTLDNIDRDGFKDFHIFLDLYNFDYEIQLYNLTDKRELFVSGMTKAINTIESLLKVNSSQTDNFVFDDDQLTSILIYKWDKTKIGNNSTIGMKYLGIDLYIFVRFGNSTEMGKQSLASASAKYLEPDSGRPILGVVNLNKDIDYSKENSFQFFEMIILHEFTHILGFSSYFFTEFFHNIATKIDDYGINRAYINSPKVVEVAKKYYNCDSLIGVELEEYGGSETRSSHWEARILLGEYMNGVAYNEEVVISEFTLALLEDSGFYKANYYTGGLMQYGKNKGCDFLNKKCMNNGKVDPKFKNEFFDSIYYLNYDPSCSSGRQSRAYHGIFLYQSIPLQYQYYSNATFGGRSSADYCPVSQELNFEANNSYYVGHCSEKGSGEYGSRIAYKNSQMQINFYKSGEISSITGETYSNNSFCVLSSLISKNIENYSLYSNTVRAVCYQMHCSNQSLTIQINDNFFVCPRQGGKINATNFDGYLLCPDYYLICSGTVLCNDIFDCVEKKSLIKENIIYDYDIKTSQDIKDAENEEPSLDAYELSDNGKCPKFCSNCNEKSQCIKCKNDYGVYELKDGELTKRDCKLISELNNYYLYEEVYYKCMDNCQKCENGLECIICNSNYVNVNKKCFLEIENCTKYDDNGKCSRCLIGFKVSEGRNGCERGIEDCEDFDSEKFICNSCKNNFRLSQNLCYKKIENCEEYEEGESCKKCKNGYAFEENNTLNCYDINEFSEYYSKDNNTSFLKCDGDGEERIKNCKKCEYNNNELNCTECKNDYILKDDENNICYSKEEFIDDNKYYYEDEYHLKTCSKTINNCETCTNQNGRIICDKCEDEYRLSLSKNECFKIIENCDKYEEGELCNKCKEGFAFEGEERKICKQFDSLEEYYTKNNGTSYYKCDNAIDNCLKCEYNNEVKCIECKNNYILKDDENNKCYLNETFKDNKAYYYEDYFHIKTCSKTIIKCDECQKQNENVICEKCELNYFIVNNNSRSCKNKDEIIPIEEFYFDNEANEYFFCGNKNYHRVENCLECENKNDCILCQEGYAFINSDKLLCKNIDELGKKYLPDENDNTIYRKCSDYMNNCDTCSSKEICLSCVEQYGLFNDKKTCIKINEQYHYKNKKDDLYYLCNTSIHNCEKCTAENICINCIANFAKKDNDKSICHPISDINTNEYYIDPNDNNMYLKCSSLIQNCFLCENQFGCKQCETGFILINDDLKRCYDKSEISLHSFFTEDNFTYYSCNDDKYKSNINCFSKITNQNIVLTFLQVQLIKHKLVCFMLTHSPLPKNFSLKFKINIFSKKIRNLQNSEEKEVILVTNDDSNGSSNTIIRFSSDQEYDDSVSNIQVNDIEFDNKNPITKVVTDNNICSTKFDKNSDFADTGKVHSLIDSKKTPDYSLINRDEDIVNLKMDKIENCEFNLNSSKSVYFSNEKFELEFIENNNKDKILTSDCDIKNKNTNSINCKINDDANNKYSLKEKIISLSDKLLIISTEYEIFKITCEKGKSNMKKILIISIVVIGIIFLICLCVCINYCCCNKKKNQNLNILPTNNSNNIQNYNPHNEIYMYNQKNNSKSYRSDYNSGIRLHKKPKRNLHLNH